MNAPDTPRAGWVATLERLGAMPAFLEAALHEAGEDHFAMRPSEDAFSLVEHACHLRDLEREGYLVRVRRILTEKTPALEPFDGQAVAEARDYASQDAHAAAQDFAAARRELLAVLAVLAALAPDDLEREATFEGRRIMLADLAILVDAHDAEHRQEIERILDDIED
jgi:hypothetical protein